MNRCICFGPPMDGCPEHDPIDAICPQDEADVWALRQLDRGKCPNDGRIFPTSEPCDWCLILPKDHK
jgi:hypothetical protein